MQEYNKAYQELFVDAQENLSKKLGLDAARKKAEEMKLLAPDEGVDFEPKYLKPKGGQI